MGKPVKESVPEVEKCAWVMEYYGDNGPNFLNDEAVNTDARKNIETFQPLLFIKANSSQLQRYFNSALRATKLGKN
jgi:hypothetical protein